jgi:hypothetical protein
MSDSIEDDTFVGREMPTRDFVGNIVSMMVHCAHHLRFLIPCIQTEMALVEQVLHGLLSLIHNGQMKFPMNPIF